MSQITIQCRLVASELTRLTLWKLMAEKNTPLINELLEQVFKHPDFETWRQKGKLPNKFVKELCGSLKTEERFSGQPSRFLSSASALVNYIYKSWLALQQRRQRQLEGLTRWLEMLKSDSELATAANCSLDALRAKAAEILHTACAQSAPVNPNTHKSKKGLQFSLTGNVGKKTKKRQRGHGTRSLSNLLFEAYHETEDSLSRCAISYLLKNGCKVTDKEENPQKFAMARKKVEIRVHRLQEQLESRIPKGRELTSQRFLETLVVATTTVPKNESHARSWQDNLLKKPKSVPFPVDYETNEDLTWFRNEKGRLCVHFNGLSEHTFEVYCDRRQLHWFERFLEDKHFKDNNKDQYTSSLFTLRSGRIVWAEGEGKGDPWSVHHLTLYCTVDTRLWTSEGTEQVRQEKATDIAKTLIRMKEKGDLDEKQQAFVKRKHTTLARINNSFPRPNKALYQGQSHILVGVSLGLDKPATACVANATTGKVLTYRSVRQLLGDDYKLLNRQRQQQQRNSHQRHKAQKHSKPNYEGESELGQYVDRLLATAIVALAQNYQAGSIVLPKLGDMREIVQSEILSLAEQKCPGYLEGQQKYAASYRSSVHRWSYGRLIESIKSQAALCSIVIEEGQQPLIGSPQEKAKDLAISVYKSRTQAII